MKNPTGTVVEPTGNGDAGDGTPRFVAFIKPNRPITFHTASMTIAAVLLTLLMASCCDCSRSQQTGYIDAHSHTNGILPYYAYADLYKFIEDPANPSKVDIQQRCRLWQAIVSTIEEQQRLKVSEASNPASARLKKANDGVIEDDAWKPIGPGNRYAPGALATINAYKNLDCDHPDQASRKINGALERVLTTTPWTEFDSAYAFRGTPVDAYLEKLYPNDQMPWCDATILELARTKTIYSEQFLPFIGGWNFVNGHSSKLDTVRCFVKRPAVLDFDGRFQSPGMPKPAIKIMLMTSTSELGLTADGLHWLQFGESGKCKETTEGLRKTSPEAIRNALLGRDYDGTKVIQADEESAFLDGVIGVDTAGPEITCFTSTKENSGIGMDNYKRLVRAVYSASRERRRAGWHGKLLVHTHVGEGAVAYSINNPQQTKGSSGKSKNSTNAQAKNVKSGMKQIFDIFQTIPEDSLKDESQASQNIKVLIQTVRELKQEIPNLYDFVVFRFGHVTHATLQDARDMRDLKIEADINLESNIATRAYSSQTIVLPVKLMSEDEQFEYNNLPKKVLNEADPAKVLVNHSLKFMLEAGVRTLLGTDGGGEEHSDIAREYELTRKLIDYWKANDPDFRSRVPSDMSINVIYQNGEAHLKDLKEDKKVD